MNEREIFDMLLEKHPAWMENIKLKGRVDERERMLSPYDVESIEELIQNVRAKTIEELINELKHNSTNISETGYQYHEYSDDELDEIAEQMKEVRNE